MARVTVEDCLEKVENRFELVMVASKRARELANSSKEAFVDWEDDKATVVALREIAAGHITADILIDKPESPDDSFEIASVELTTDLTNIDTTQVIDPTSL